MQYIQFYTIQYNSVHWRYQLHISQSWGFMIFYPRTWNLPGSAWHTWPLPLGHRFGLRSVVKLSWSPHGSWARRFCWLVFYFKFIFTVTAVCCTIQADLWLGHDTRAVKPTCFVDIFVMVCRVIFLVPAKYPLTFCMAETKVITACIDFRLLYLVSQLNDILPQLGIFCFHFLIFSSCKVYSTLQPFKSVAQFLNLELLCQPDCYCWHYFLILLRFSPLSPTCL